MTRTNRLFTALLIAAFLLSTLSACSSGSAIATWWQSTPQSTTPTAVAATAPTAAVARGTPTTSPNVIYMKRAGFARYSAISSDVRPSVAPYTVTVGLANVSNAKQFKLSSEQVSLLERNAFVVSPSDNKEFYQLYEAIRYSELPAFVSVDSVMHIYHLLFDKLLRDLEQQKLAPEMSKLSETLLASSLKQYEELKGSALESAAKRNAAFFAVGAQLLNPNLAVPALVKDVVAAELALMAAHKGLSTSPALGYQEDYSQYVPRGHYTKSKVLENYFKAMMWYGRVNFRLKPPTAIAAGRDETRSALLMVSALRQNPSSLAAWQNTYDVTSFFVGPSDDLTVYEYGAISDEMFGANAAIRSFADEARLTAFIDRALQAWDGQINSMAVSPQLDRASQIAGFRWMGQRFVLDGAIFQRLVDREVPGRMLPKGLDLLAAFGSEEASAVLKSLGETNLSGYQDQMTKAKKMVAAMKEDEWTQNLYSGWLYTVKGMVAVPTAGYPSFMQSQAWLRKCLNSALASWTELKHDTVLYSKQVYAEAGGGPEGKPKGYVEPAPEVYARLAALTRMTIDGLKQRQMLTAADEKNLVRLELLVNSLRTISEKELNGRALTTAEFSLIENYGTDLEYFTIVSAEPPAGDAGGRKYIESLDAALVTDVATDLRNGLVLQEGTGRVADILVVVPMGGLLQIVRGGVFLQYEFTQPLANRLTDEAWRKMLDDGKNPALPAYTKSFVAPGPPRTR